MKEEERVHLKRRPEPRAQTHTSALWPKKPTLHLNTTFRYDLLPELYRSKIVQTDPELNQKESVQQEPDMKEPERQNYIIPAKSMKKDPAVLQTSTEDRGSPERARLIEELTSVNVSKVTTKEIKCLIPTRTLRKRHYSEVLQETTEPSGSPERKWARLLEETTSADTSEVTSKERKCLIPTRSLRKRHYSEVLQETTEPSGSPERKWARLLEETTSADTSEVTSKERKCLIPTRSLRKRYYSEVLQETMEPSGSPERKRARFMEDSSSAEKYGTVVPQETSLKRFTSKSATKERKCHKPTRRKRGYSEVQQKTMEPPVSPERKRARISVQSAAINTSLVQKQPVPTTHNGPAPKKRAWRPQVKDPQKPQHRGAPKLNRRPAGWSYGATNA